MTVRIFWTILGGPDIDLRARGNIISEGAEGTEGNLALADVRIFENQANRGAASCGTCQCVGDCGHVVRDEADNRDGMDRRVDDLKQSLFRLPWWNGTHV